MKEYKTVSITFKTIKLMKDALQFMVDKKRNVRDIIEVLVNIIFKISKNK